jgi:hypothetical protein
VTASQFPSTVTELQERIDASSIGGPTHDDQSRTWDGRVLDSKDKVLQFIAELDEARRAGRVLGPPLDG